LPNIFTAIADIALGWCCILAGGAGWDTWPLVVLIAAASACLYSSGMALNDYFDVEQDRYERPFRPIPSGRVSRRIAGVIGVWLQVVGLCLATLTGYLASGSSWTPPIIALTLTVAIYAYDGWLKKTPFGPIAMGACRSLNVLLGLSIADPEIVPWASRIYVASIVGLYIAGVTWFARTEARMSSRRSLLAAAAVIFVALVLVIPVPVVVPSTPSVLFLYLLVALGFTIGFPIAAALQKPAPAEVQRAIKLCLVCLVALDAIVASAVAGTAALIILVLLVPVLYLGRWIYST
jgi:4-hydroxybenzoate polyprenyltransferase